MAGSGEHTFGGQWTKTKLAILAEYLKSYLVAMENQPFKLGYIDAFAGSGSILTGDRSNNKVDGVRIPELQEEEPMSLLRGSAHIALDFDPGFDRYIFIEKNRDRCKQLESLKQIFPSKSEKILIKQSDANIEIQNLCLQNWKRHRAVLFLDPYGMQVDWKTIEAVAQTKAIDMWLLFPLGQAINRLLSTDGVVDEGWRRALDRVFGTDKWEEALYRAVEENDLFGQQQKLVKQPIDVIGSFFVDRLKNVFAGVSEEPAVLRNSVGCPLYLFCFAAANEKGAPIALKIANHILGKIRENAL